MDGLRQEVDDLGQLKLGLVLTGNIGEGDLWPLRIMLARLAATEAEHVLLTTAHRASHEQDQPEEQQQRHEIDEQEQGSWNCSAACP